MSLAAVVGTSIGALGLGYVIGMSKKPSNSAYRTAWHELAHKSSGIIPDIFYSLLFNEQCSGQIASVNASVMSSDGIGGSEVKVFGLVCQDCGHVNVNYILSGAYNVEKFVYVGKPYNTHLQSTKGFTWVSSEEVSNLREFVQKCEIRQ